MIEGLWIVQYEGIQGGDGGVVVFINGQVLGGDNGFVYTGSYQNAGNALSARVLIRNYAPAIGNVLGIPGDFELTIQGTFDGKVIKGSASLVNQQGPGLVVKLTKVSDLTI